MQLRHKDRERYFEELAATSREFYVPYLAEKGVAPASSVLEIGCGEGGNLLPFAQDGSRVTGVDLAPGKIEKARAFFEARGAEGRFEAGDFFKSDFGGERFPLIIAHDVIEHIPDKTAFLTRIGELLTPGGKAFIAFPAWQMPFGGHQQNARSRFISHFPFLHLLPAGLYRRILKAAGEKPEVVSELMEIRDTRCPVEKFERCVRGAGLQVADRRLWLINPHYKAKFGLRPRRLARWLAAVPWLRNFFSTSCFYILSK